MGLIANPSPIFLVWFLLQSREQADETVLILVQSARGPCCQVGIIFLVEPGKSQVQTGPDIFQDKGQHLCLESGVKLCYEAGQDLDAHLEVGADFNRALHSCRQVRNAWCKHHVNRVQFICYNPSTQSAQVQGQPGE